MALTLENGSVVSGANAYATEDMADDYFENRGNSDWTDGDSDDKEAALIRATAAIDARYRGRWPGFRAAFRAQSLEWPRQAAYDNEDNLISAVSIPPEVINATLEAAARELASPGSMIPDLERGGAVRMLKAGSVEIEYAANAEMTTTFQLIDGLLSGILQSGSGGGLFGYAVRG